MDPLSKSHSGLPQVGLTLHIRRMSWINWVQGNPTGLVELSLAHEQQPLLEINLRHFEVQRLGHAQTGAG